MVTSETVDKEGPPGSPPTPGQIWNQETHRWINPKGIPDAPDMKRLSPGDSAFRLQRLSTKLNGESVVAGLATLEKALEGYGTIPIEAIKGDLGRMGHSVKQLLAIDPDSRRVFFTNKLDEPLYATYSQHNWAIEHVGYQAEVAKEYDPVDLEAEPRSTVVTTHLEEDVDDTPGFVPAGNPGTFADAREDEYVSEALDKSLSVVEELISEMAF
ncbi:hypothetical protein LCGC14_0264560 [marine sediment metagenome]|uniref:Uncharacterized protein n=1 Tax=marine sediment metagenome TaxID=412755 RepID=A0A0F9U5L5_9ZZZZ